ncbi:MAG: hypothetical protein J6K72_09495 [Clostridia bacterium]|nr:hypothetical protein [Clostridia bacterium]
MKWKTPLKKAGSSFLFVSKRKEAKENRCSFFLSQKERTKEKPLLTGPLPGRGFPMMSRPMKQANKSNKKGKPASHPSTWVEAGFSFATFLFY